jgi:hypothetical protein
MDEAIKAINELLITQDEINKMNDLAIKILQNKVVELEAKIDKVKRISDGEEHPEGYPFK